MRRGLVIAGAALVVGSAAARPAQAQGSGVDQQSACMTARVGAGIAAPCADASAVYFSPAGLAMTPSAIGIGATIIRAGGGFTYHPAVDPNTPALDRDDETIPVPQAFVNVRLGQRAAVGLGVFAPYGLGLKWPVCSGGPQGCQETNFEGRFTGYDNSLRGLYIQPTVAYQVIPRRLSIGAGVDYVRGNIEVHQRADNPQIGLLGVDIADVVLEGSGTGITGHLGALAQLSPATSVGVRYMHSVTLDMDGDATFTQIATGVPGIDQLVGAQFAPGGALENQGISTEIELPAQLVVGIAHRPTERLGLLFDYQRTWWSSFDQFDIDFAAGGRDAVLALGYRDTNTFRFGADFALSRMVALRGGFRYNTAATPRATPFLPEGERNYYSAGIGFRPMDRLGLDLSYQYINQPDREGATRPGGANVGVYSSEGQTFGVTLSYRFGAATTR